MHVIFGATGNLGHLVIESLLEKTEPASIRAVGRDAAKAADLIERGVSFVQADYDQPATLAAALDGATRVLLISSSEVGKRVPQHQAVIDAAKSAGVELIAYTSILHADDSPLGLATEHRATEAALNASGLPCVLLRNGWYNENYEMAVAASLEHGLIGCAGDGRISAASRADYAAAAATVLCNAAHAGKTYELAGDQSFTMAELAAEISQQAGATVTYTNLPQSDYSAALQGAGLPAPFADLLADSDAGAAKGGLFDDSGTLGRLIGRSTTSIAQTVGNVLAANK